MLCVIATQTGVLVVDDFNTRFSNALAAALVRMTPNACLRELKEKTSKGELSKKKRENPKNGRESPYYEPAGRTVDGESKGEQKRLKKPKGYKDWWEDKYYENPPLNTGGYYSGRYYRGRRLLPPNLGGAI